MPICLAACVGEKQNVILDTLLKGLENPNSVIEKASLNPNFRYLKVEVNGQSALLVLGYQDQSPNGMTDIWYSSFKEVVELSGGRLTSTQGLDINWTDVNLQKPPTLTDEKLFQVKDVIGQYTPVRFQRVRTVMPSYRANITETVELQALPSVPDDAPRFIKNTEVFPNLRWVQETVVMQTNVSSPYLAPLKAIYAIDSKSSKVIYGKQYLTTEYYVSWLVWPVQKVESATTPKQSLEKKSN